MPGGNFYDSLARVADPGTVSFFLWSGENRHETRVEAAHQLVEFIHMHIPKNSNINLVTHSHGSNVGILASQLLANDPNNTHRIHRFYALGTPTNTISYMPNMDMIDYFYNFFSFNDFIQPVFGLFGREYPEHERIANIYITIDNREPQHSDLHDPIVAQWITRIHQDLKQKEIGGFDRFEFVKPGTINFYKDQPPQYQVDTQREDRQNRDRAIIFGLNNIVRKKISASGFIDKNYFRHLRQHS